MKIAYYVTEAESVSKESVTRTRTVASAGRRRGAAQDVTRRKIRLPIGTYYRYS